MARAIRAEILKVKEEQVQIHKIGKWICMLAARWDVCLGVAWFETFQVAN
jgi:hypothetical protein